MIGQLIEELCVANIKLFMLCDEKAAMANSPGDYSKKDMTRVMKQDVLLCKRRAQLKSKIDKELARSIIEGEMDSIEEVKNYASGSG